MYCYLWEYLVEKLTGRRSGLYERSFPVVSLFHGNNNRAAQMRLITYESAAAEYFEQLHMIQNKSP